MRQAGTGDISAIRGLAEIAFRHTYRDILSPEQMEYMMEMMYSEESLTRQMTAEGNTFFIEEGRGYVSFRRDGKTEDGKDRFHLEKIYVLPEFQGTGLGNALFKKVCDSILELSPDSPLLELNVNRNNPAVSFYEHLGMHKARQGDFDIGNGFYMNDYIMAKTIEK